jgi:hypothetical protein
VYKKQASKCKAKSTLTKSKSPKLAAKGKPPRHWTTAEEKVLSSLKTPEQIQTFVDKMPFDQSDSTFSVRQCLEYRTGDCFSCGLLAAYCLSRLGYPPLLLGMECDPSLDEPGHIIVPYRQGGLWGAISKSNYTGIRGRDPVYATVRELVMSYFEFLVSKDGVKILRTYSDPFNLNKVDRTEDWIWRTDVHSGGCHIEPYSDICPRKCLPKGFQRNKLTKMSGTTLKAQIMAYKN